MRTEKYRCKNIFFTIMHWLLIIFFIPVFEWLLCLSVIFYNGDGCTIQPFAGAINQA